jgi:hypothetical protein
MCPLPGRDVMNPLSERARLMLERYKVLETMSGSEKTRLLESIRQANARGLLPRFEVGPAPSTASRGTSFGRRPSAPAMRLIIVSALLALPAVAAVAIAVRQALGRASICRGPRCIDDCTGNRQSGAGPGSRTGAAGPERWHGTR